MDILSFDVKPSGSTTELGHAPSLPIGSFRASLRAGCIVVEDTNDSQVIYENGCFGQMLGDRQDRVSSSIFAKDDEGQMGPEGMEWGDRLPARFQLQLSAEETAYLSIDCGILRVAEQERPLDQVELWNRLMSLGGRLFVRRLAVYRHLRKNGWCVRSGLPYGCQYLIYRDGPDSHHASAAVLLEDSMDKRSFVAVNRALTNMKKAVVLATLLAPSQLDTTSPECIEAIVVKTTTCSTFFVEKKLKEDFAALGKKNGK